VEQYFSKDVQIICAVEELLNYGGAALGLDLRNGASENYFRDNIVIIEQSCVVKWTLLQYLRLHINYYIYKNYTNIFISKHKFCTSTIFFLLKFQSCRLLEMNVGEIFLSERYEYVQPGLFLGI